MSTILGALVLALPAGPIIARQVTVNRIVARVENDIILQSDVRELQRYQELLDGKSESQDQALDRLIDQWIVRSEAELSQFPHPKDEDVDRGVQRVEKSFASTEEYKSREKQCGMTDAEVRKIVASQLYLSNYLDSRFRPSSQVSEAEIEDFYQKKIIPTAQARGQQPPTLDAARETIQEALIQGKITAQTDQWLKESRDRLQVEKYLGEGSK
ncbi:MAG TPA: hypothetical protein VJN93_00840 [Candidatus Acidoferrum sp.]|nr:hypothetical protein [Candidatus Acidoferrum sp.]